MLFGFGTTTITTVPITATVVVFVVTLAVSHPGEHLAVTKTIRILFYELRILAHAINAVVKLIFFTPAAVTTVPVATTVVVCIVASLVAFPCQNLASTLAFACVWVLTLAFLAVTVLFLCVFLAATAVTAIPATATDVVRVVAEIITTPNVYPALSIAFDTFTVYDHALVVGVMAFAVATVHFEVHVPWSATVATVPVATALVIFLITNIVTLPGKHLTSPIAHRMRIVAETFFAIFIVVIRPATVPAIPIKFAIVVVVVACAIALPWSVITSS